MHSLLYADNFESRENIYYETEYCNVLQHEMAISKRGISKRLKTNKAVGEGGRG